MKIGEREVDVEMMDVDGGEGHAAGMRLGSATSKQDGKGKRVAPQG